MDIFTISKLDGVKKNDVENKSNLQKKETVSTS